MSELTNLDDMELFGQVTKEQPAKHQATMNFTNPPNPNNKINLPYKLNKT